MEKVRKSRMDRYTAVDFALIIFFVLLSLMFLYPIWYCLITSLTSGSTLRTELPLLLPKNFTFNGYIEVFHGKNILLFYRNSVFYAVAGTVISLALTAMMAFPFTVDDFRGKKFFNLFMVITMFISGGLLPYYFLITGLGWRNTAWVMLIPGAVSAYNVIIFRTFFNNIPSSLREAAYIDGAGHYRVLAQIILPVSLPLLATFALFGMVEKWNDWFTPNLFLTKEAFKPIQLYLRECLIKSEHIMSQFSTARLTRSNVVELNIKCAIVIITIAPILCVYPFLQKYFAGGMLVGSIKA